MARAKPIRMCTSQFFTLPHWWWKYSVSLLVCRPQCSSPPRALSALPHCFTHAGKKTADILWWWNWFYSRPWKGNGQPKVTRRNFKFGVWIYVYKSSSTHGTCVKVTACVYKKTALYWTPALCLGAHWGKMKARVICKHKLIWRVNLVYMAAGCLSHNLAVVDAAARAQSWLNSAAVQMVQVILFGLLSVPAVGWVVGRLLSQGSPPGSSGLNMDIAGSTQQNDACTHRFQRPINAETAWMREEECEERERGRRSEGETARRRERAQWQSERKEKFKLYLLVVCSVKVLFVCPTSTRQSRASVFVTRVAWWREWPTRLHRLMLWNELHLKSLQIFAYRSLKAFRSDARDAEKAATVLVVYIQCTVAPGSEKIPDCSTWTCVFVNVKWIQRRPAGVKQ